MTYSAEAEILHLLRAGHSAYKVAPMTGYSYRTVRDVRDRHGIDVTVPGMHDRLLRRAPRFEVVEPEADGVGAGDPWIPPDGYDLYADRPQQRRWLAVLSGARSWERPELRQAVCTVLGFTGPATDADMVVAVIADHRTAEELAGLYLAARVRRWTV